MWFPLSLISNQVCVCVCLRVYVCVCVCGDGHAIESFRFVTVVAVI